MALGTEICDLFVIYCNFEKNILCIKTMNLFT